MYLRVPGGKCLENSVQRLSRNCKVSVIGFLNVLVDCSHVPVKMVAFFASQEQINPLNIILYLKFTEHILQIRHFFFRWNKNLAYLAIMENSNILKPSYFLMIPIDPQTFILYCYTVFLFKRLISKASWVSLP